MFYWRQVALVCLCAPILTVIVIFFIPETPFWLLAHDKPAEALKALQWLRGWAPSSSVATEFREMQRYCGNAKQCLQCNKSVAAGPSPHKECDHGMLSRKWHSFFEARNLKPFFIVTMFLVFTQLSGLAAMRPYLVQLLQAFQVPIDAKRATAMVGLLKLAANLTIMGTVKFVGKRRLSLLSACGVTVCGVGLGTYAYLYLPHYLRSAEAIPDAAQASYVPLIGFFALAFMTSLGMAPIPWMLLSEVLPINARAITSGVAVTINYVVVFGATKTYLQLEQSLTMFGVIWLYAAVAGCGFVFLFCLLPETENRTLEEIEYHFAKRPMTQTVIERFANASDVEENKKRETVELL